MHQPFSGVHCESTTFVNMLRSRDIELSEPMVFGLGQGLSFLYWHSRQMPGPFLGGRVKPDQLIRNASAALGQDLVEHETASRAKAATVLHEALDAGEVVGLKLDRYHLDYADDSFHFAAHYLACVGYDETDYTVVETDGLGVRTTSRASLAEARLAPGPMSSKNRSVRFGAVVPLDPARLPSACREAVAATAAEFLEPPIANMGYKGIEKTSTLIRDWCDTLDDPGATFSFLSHSIEDGGTGGGFFRQLWSQFLDEAAELTGDDDLAKAAASYRDLGERWSELARILLVADDDGDQRRAVQEAGDLLVGIGADERDTMARLAEATS